MRMTIKLSKTNEQSKIPMGKAYYNFLNRNMDANENVMHVETDLGFSILKGDMLSIMDKYPDQYVDVGIAEANAVGVACGLSQTGKIPFVHSFGTFMSRRVADQVFISGAYSGANVKLIGSDPGIIAAYNGGTHMPFEDVAIMRAIPEMTIVEPSDPVLAEAIFNMAVEQEGMFYIRLNRKGSMELYEEGSRFELGKGNVIRNGDDVTIIAAGIMVEEGVKACEILKEEGINARLIDMFTIKPMDWDLVVKCAKETGAIVTAENHNVINGLGSAVAEIISEEYPVPLMRVGSQDRFGQVGDVNFLKKEYGMTAENIAIMAKKAIARKR